MKLYDSGNEFLNKKYKLKFSLKNVVSMALLQKLTVYLETEMI